MAGPQVPRAEAGFMRASDRPGSAGSRRPVAEGVPIRPDNKARAILTSIGDAVLTTDTAGLVTYLNPVAERLTGWSLSEARGQPLALVVPIVSEATRLVLHPAAICMADGRTRKLQDGVLLLRRDGTDVPIGDSTAPVRDSHGTITGVVLIIQDETEKRRVGRRLSWQATHDPLTGLINRREFERRLARVVSDATATASEHVLLCLDLDRFKAVNDTCGHSAGDTVLRNLSALLSRQLRKRDTLARLGGDEFAALLENCTVLEAERIAEGFRTAIASYQFEHDGRTFTIGASIGLIPVTGESGASIDVLRAADAACYAAKASGGNRVAPPVITPLSGYRSPIRATSSAYRGSFRSGS